MTCTRKGGYELLIPTNLTEELKPYLSKDLDVDVVEEGDALNVIITHRICAKTEAGTNEAFIPSQRNKEVLQEAEEY